MLLGEALGREEDQRGKPFVGDAGLKLAYLLSRAKLRRSDLAIGNAARCRPPSNRTPTVKETRACLPYLARDLLVYKPGCVLGLGATALKTIYDSNKAKLGDQRGFPIRVELQTPKRRREFWFIPTHHPAAALRDWRKDAELIRDLRAAWAYAHDSAFYHMPKTKVRVAHGFDESIALCRLVGRQREVVLDTETIGLQPYGGRVLCVGFCWKPGETHVLPLRTQGGVSAFTSVEHAQLARHELADALLKPKLVGHNLKYDLKHLRAETGLIDEWTIGDDTMLLHHVLDENARHGLTPLTQWYLKWDHYAAVMKPYLSNTTGYKDAPDQLCWQYLGYDCDGTKQLLDIFRPRIKKHGLRRVANVERDLTIPLADAEYRGIRVDLGRVMVLSARERQALAAADEKMDAIAFDVLGAKRYAQTVNPDSNDGRFNPRSHKQMSVLIKKAKGKTARGEKERKTTGGGVSTDRFALGEMRQRGGIRAEIADAMTSMRRATKNLGTYLDGSGGGIPGMTIGDRLHETFNVHGARTGRLTAELLLLVPRQHGIRTAFIPDRPEHVFIQADYSKLELRLAAWLSNDEVMGNELISGVDLHTHMAVTRKLMRLPGDEEYERLKDTIVKEERSLAKCFHPDTEVLTKTGWKRILSLVDGEEVLQAVPGFGGEVVFEWVVPQEVFSMRNEFDHLLHFENEGIDLLVTPDHKMLVWPSTGSGPWRSVSAEQFAERKYRYWANGGWLEQRASLGTRAKEHMLRLAVATQADGNFNGRRIRFGFTKKRKIERMRALLRIAAAHNKRFAAVESTRRRVTTFTFNAEISSRIKALLDGKSLPWWWVQLRYEARQWILNEAQYWDGHKGPRMRCYHYSNTDEQSIDVLQAIAHVTGMKTRKVEKETYEPQHSRRWVLSVKDHNHTRSGNLTTTKVPYRGQVACLTVDSHCVLVRRANSTTERVGYAQIPVVTKQSVNFGVVYGLAETSLVDRNPELFPKDMSRDARIDQATQVFNAHRTKYATFHAWSNRMAVKAKRGDEFRTWFFNRERRFKPGVLWLASRWGQQTWKARMELGHIEREGRNFPIQSFASDLLSWRTPIVYRAIKKARIPGFRIVLTLHDALMFTVHRDYVEQAIALVKRCMQVDLPKLKSRRFAMPLLVDVQTQEVWGEENFDLSDEAAKRERDRIVAARKAGLPMRTIEDLWEWQDRAERWNRRLKRAARAE